MAVQTKSVPVRIHPRNRSFATQSGTWERGHGERDKFEAAAGTGLAAHDGKGSRRDSQTAGLAIMTRQTTIPWFSSNTEETGCLTYVGQQPTAVSPSAKSKPKSKPFATPPVAEQAVTNPVGHTIPGG